MPLFRIKEIKEMSSEERKKKSRELKTELILLKTMIKAGGAIENPARVSELRKAIARILTIENEPSPSNNKEKQTKKKRKKKS